MLDGLSLELITQNPLTSRLVQLVNKTLLGRCSRKARRDRRDQARAIQEQLDELGWDRPLCKRTEARMCKIRRALPLPVTSCLIFNMDPDYGLCHLEIENVQLRWMLEQVASTNLVNSQPSVTQELIKFK